MIKIVHDSNKRRASACNHKAKNNNRPRLLVRRTGRHIYAQVINNLNGNIIATASTVEKDITVKTGIAAAEEIGKLVAERTVAAGFPEVCFDRNGLKYHGCVKSLADAARKAGLNF